MSKLILKSSVIFCHSRFLVNSGSLKMQSFVTFRKENIALQEKILFFATL